MEQIIMDLPSQTNSKKRKKKKPTKLSNMIRHCILYNSIEANLILKCLKPLQKTYIRTPSSLGDCLFEAVLTSLATPVDPQQGVYTAFHLRLQVCMHMINNYERMLTLEPVKLFLQAECTSLYHCVQKSMEEDFWADHTLLHVIHDMWKVNLSMINVWQRNTLSYHYGTHTDILQSDIVIIYNGHNHFTGTGKCLIFSCFFLLLLHAWLAFFLDLS